RAAHLAGAKKDPDFLSLWCLQPEGATRARSEDRRHQLRRARLGQFSLSERGQELERIHAAILPRNSEGLRRMDLSQGLVHRDARAGGKIEASRARLRNHRHAHLAAGKTIQQLLWEPAHLVAEDQVIAR